MLVMYQFDVFSKLLEIPKNIIQAEFDSKSQLFTVSMSPELHKRLAHLGFSLVNQPREKQLILWFFLQSRMVFYLPPPSKFPRLIWKAKQILTLLERQH